jgi:hypothetical protein
MTRFCLLFSAAGLLAIALSYGVAPAEVLPKLLDVKVEGMDLKHIFRAVMGLYLAMIVLWVIGAFRPAVTRTAVIAEITFMIGLAFGRVISFAVDGIPSTLLVVYAVLEITMAVFGLIVFTKLQKAEQVTLARSA